MDIRVGDVLVLRKPHPCGGTEWTVTRIGADFKLSCTTCGREVMRPRSDVERAVRRILRDGETIVPSRRKA